MQYLGRVFRALKAKARWTRAGVVAIRRTGLELRGFILGLGLRDASKVGPPHGGFSAFDDLNSQNCPSRGRVVLQSQTPPTTTPGSLRALSNLNQNGFQPWPHFWAHYAEARLVGPTLVLLDHGKRACYESMFCQQCMSDDPGYNHLYRPPVTRLQGEWTSLVARWGTGYYHWLHDVLPRLGVLDELPKKTLILVPPRLTRYMKESLELLGISGRLRKTPETNLIIEDFFFVSPTAMTGVYNPYAVDFLRSRFLRNKMSGVSPPKRFLITRRGKTRGIVNEAELIDRLGELGWAVIDTEALGFREQIALFSQAEAICGLHGAAMANIVWCRPGCKILELCAHTFLNGCYEALAECVGCEHHFIIFKGDPHNRIRVDVKQIEKTIRSW